MAKRGVNLAKIKSAIPDIEITDELESLADKLDKHEAVEKFIKSEDGSLFREHFAEELAEAIVQILAEKEDNFRPKIERLRALVGFYKMLSEVEHEAELYRRMVDEIIENNI